ncbi:MAG TPA: cation:proton antiporter, partial [Longimicrobiales bacterium]|nr:cation:proton antiporter [Longimicrobiales bacterium]
MVALTLLLVTAAISMAVAQFLRAPPIPVLILGGVALSGVARPPEALLDSVLILGVSFLVFAMGLELDPRRVRVQRRAVLWVGTVQFLALAGLGFAVARWMGFSAGEAAFVTLALPASSTLVGVRLLQRRRQMYEPFGRLVLGVLLLQDALVILFVPVVLGAAAGWTAMAGGVGAVLLLGGAALAARSWVTPHLLRVSDEREAILLG